ncbi:MAG: histidinol-phosphatase HisJ family protein [Clostridia bacterium]|nr:histidinol-phosphatase HisJ family protein [Clostridia bacterium]
MYLCDFHVHTAFSHIDCTADPDQVCQQALEQGLKEIAFTEHHDANEVVAGSYHPFDIAGHKAAVEELRERYRGKLIIHRGVELGQPAWEEQEARRVLAQGQFDFIIGSVHSMPDVIDFYYDDFSEKDLEAHFDIYMKYLELHSRWKGYDVCGHLTYPLTYYTKFGRHLSLDRWMDVYRTVLSNLIHNGVGIEVNTAGLRRPLNDFMPCRQVLELYRQLGGELITVGSDAHRPCEVGTGIRQAGELLKSLGFRWLTTYQQHSPVQHAL